MSCSKLDKRDSNKSVKFSLLSSGYFSKLSNKESTILDNSDSNLSRAVSSNAEQTLTNYSTLTSTSHVAEPSTSSSHLAQPRKSKSTNIKPNMMVCNNQKPKAHKQGKPKSNKFAKKDNSASQPDIRVFLTQDTTVNTRPIFSQPSTTAVVTPTLTEILVQQRQTHHRTRGL